jgi:hypothetical protein
LDEFQAENACLAARRAVKKFFGLPKSVNLTFQDSEPCPFLLRQRRSPQL